jgi:hypothetical protein
MPASDAVPVIIGAAIGAGGAVIAQVTSAVFTARRETERLTWEKERQAREWKVRESERFLSHKQELYSRYLSMTYQPIMDTLQLTGKEYAIGEDWHALVPEFTESFESELNSLRWNIRLLGAPVVFERIEYSHVTLILALLQAKRPTECSLKSGRSSLTTRCELGSKLVTPCALIFVATKRHSGKFRLKHTVRIRHPTRLNSRNAGGGNGFTARASHLKNFHSAKPPPLDPAFVRDHQQ